jgi:hypothetical protein
MSDDRFDELIDDAAKSMTSAPPDASLAHRVSKRIAEEGERRTTRWRQPWVLVPIASACVLVVAVFVARENSRHVRLKPDAAPVTNVAPASQYVERPFQGRGDLRREVVVPLPPLTTPAIEPIDVDRLELAPVALSQIEINPIAIDRIEIAAMP